MVPGPANYSPARILTDMKSASYVFGSESRIPPPTKDAVLHPGPGQYTLPPKYKQPRFAMGIKFEDPSKDKTPGPG